MTVDPNVRSRLRVLHVEAGTTFGGSARALENYLRTATCGHDDWVCLYTPLPEMHRLKAVCRGITVVSPREHGGTGRAEGIRRAIGLLYATLGLLRLILVNRIDIVRLNNAPVVHGPAVVAASLTGRPLVAWLRSFPPRKDWRGWPSFLCRRVSHFVAVSKAVESAFLDRGLPPHQIRTLYDGTWLPPHIHHEPKAVGQAPVFGFLGRIVPWKGLTTFVQAAAMLHSQLPEARFEITGPDEPTDPSYRSWLIQEAHRLGVGGNVTLRPPISDTASYFHSLDCLVNPSFPAEPFGLSIMEAMAHGLAVVATAAGGPLEVIEDGVSGVLIPPENASALAAALLRIAGEPGWRDRLGRNARRRVEEHFEVSKRTREQEEYLETVALGSRVGRTRRDLTIGRRALDDCSAAGPSERRPDAPEQTHHTGVS